MALTGHDLASLKLLLEKRSSGSTEEGPEWKLAERYAQDGGAGAIDEEEEIREVFGTEPDENVDYS